MKRIGIDVGGTNTDGVLLDGTRILSRVKTATTADVTTGVRAALAHVTAGADPAGLAGVMIGTTHFTNAVIERRGVERVAVVRIGLPAAAVLPPFTGWPADLRRAVEGPVFMLRGGHEFDGRPIVPFDAEGMRQAARAIAASGVGSVAVCAVFSPLTAAAEEEARAILAQEAPGVAVTLSSALGRIGLLERENAAILNSCLHGLARRTVAAFRDAIAASGLAAPLYITQNDGTVVVAEVAERFPVLCFASGPTNSMRGAALLSGRQNAIVVDVGGTTSDVGVLEGGFPREANSRVDIGGVRTVFRMPDVVSIGLGGGTRVSTAPFGIGPESVGFRIREAARVFGGDTLTLTDIGVGLGLAAIGSPARVAGLDPALLARCRDWIRTALEEVIDRMKTSAAPVPVVAVGGGAFLVPETLAGVSEVVKVPDAGVANAVGAAMAQVSGEVDRIFHDMPREEAVARARAVAEARAVEAGAQRESLVLLDVEDLPLAYIPGDARRVRVRVVGDVR
ncbi:hydantoinase/oxoprolinase N-terminal domain-containing protein [Ancylobacter lacus]|uniref:hydantoinase/oxoprolinase N-terminal domain-containing protein n=1 Tax=Ancylobacter lacus TaxID=2579970 RepID=UPI001BCB689B|nr:hydantoinase/oxoprolinase family protein [Ancylobacter lacus]MBS7538247.1 hydantoinase/oxoprolinase family protein [Ancylobacter lacus]